MRKHIVFVVALVMLIVSANPAVAAENVSVVETPDIKIVAEGKPVEFKNVPITVNNNLLLPLREIMPALGVQADDKHIVYDDDQKSVMVSNEETTIILYAGRQNALINDEPAELNVAPMIYGENQLFYAPFKPIAEAFGKKVFWDGTSRVVLVCDNEKYDIIRSVIEKSNEAFAKVARYKYNMEVSSLSRSENSSIKFSIAMEASIDRLNKKMKSNIKMVFPWLEISSDSYYANNEAYIFESVSETWRRETYDEAEYNKLFEEHEGIDILKAGDLLSASLDVFQTENEDEVLLKGDVYMSNLFRSSLKLQDNGSGLSTAEDRYNFDESFVEILLDKNTHLIKQIVMNFKRAEHDLDVPLYTTVTARIQYGDYNGDFDISIPEEAVENVAEEG